MIKQKEKYPKQCENFTFFLFCSMRMTFNMHHEVVLLRDLKKKRQIKVHMHTYIVCTYWKRYMYLESHALT